jgi:hypothetical protein
MREIFSLISKKLIGYHFVIIILAAKEYTGVTDPDPGLCDCFSQPDHVNSKFGIRHAIKS